MWGSERELAYLGKGKGVGIPEGRRGGGVRIGVPTPVTAATVATRDTTG